MAQFKQGDSLNQPFLLPPSISDWLPKDHLAWFIYDAVGELDIESLLSAYRYCGKGELPYDPRMLLRVLIYAYATGVFSSRKIEKHLAENVAFRVLAGNQMPGHRTICRFRERHLDEFENLFVQVLGFAMDAGLVQLGTIAIDGSKVRASASKHKSMSYDRMKKEEKRLRKEIRSITKMAQGRDAKEDHELGLDFCENQLPEELKRREDRLAKIRSAKLRLETRKAEEHREEERRKAEKSDSEPLESDGSAGVPKEKDQENFTDPDSRIMKDKNGFQQDYNAQIAVDAEHQIIVANELTNCASDSRELIPVIEATEKNTNSKVGVVLADAGYKSEENFEKLEEKEIDAYVALGKEGKSAKRNKKELVATGRMRDRMSKKRSRKAYKKREHIVEPVFGWIKSAIGFRMFSLRRHRKVAGEWSLVCLAINLRRMSEKMTI